MSIKFLSCKIYINDYILSYYVCLHIIPSVFKIAFTSVKVLSFSYIILNSQSPQMQGGVVFTSMFGKLCPKYVFLYNRLHLCSDIIDLVVSIFLINN